jgi:hypothetical protein
MTLVGNTLGGSEHCMLLLQLPDAVFFNHIVPCIQDGVMVQLVQY